MKSYVIIFNIEDVLADGDQPIPAGVVIYNMLVTQSHILERAISLNKLPDAEIPFVDMVTSRPESERKATMAWCEANGLLMPRALYMQVKDSDLYKERYENKEEVLAVFCSPDIIRIPCQSFLVLLNKFISST